MLYAPKKLDMHVFILSEIKNVSLTQFTFDSCHNFLYKYEKTVVLSQDSDASGYENRLFCKISGGNSRLTSINCAMKNLKNEWAFFVDSGTKVQNRIDEKMSKYVDTYKDVCFPVINRVFHFPLANLNCLLISKKFYEEVGEFEDFELPELTKLIWSEKAVSLGGRLKGIVGMRC